jgi:hypothetical protein
MLSLRDHVRDRARKAKEAVGQWRHRGRRKGRKKRECRQPFTGLNKNQYLETSLELRDKNRDKNACS